MPSKPLSQRPSHTAVLRRIVAAGDSGLTMHALQEYYQRGMLQRTLRALLADGSIFRVAGQPTKFFAANVAPAKAIDEDSTTEFVASWPEGVEAVTTPKTKYTVCPNNLPPLDDPWRVR